MKKVILSLLAFFGMTMTVTAQSVTVADIEAMPGQEVMATLVLTCPENKFSGLNFSIQFPATGFSVDDKALNDWDGAKAVGEMKDGKVKFSIASTNNFAATTEVHVYFTLGDIDLKDYDLTVTDLKFDSEGTLTPATDVTFKVKVADFMTLSEDATMAPKAATGVKVKVKRTIAADTWSTICLPFAMTEAQLATAFPGGVKIGELASCIPEEDDDENVVAITVGFNSVSAIQANRPYIIKVKEGASEFSVDGVDVNPATDLKLQVGSGSKRGWMYGTFVANTEVPEECLFLNGGQFWYSKGNSMPMKAFRAYFEFKSLLTAFEETESRINITFDDVTAIKNLKTNGEEEIYTLSGQRVDKAGKGVYIVNGKKVIKK